MPSPPWQSTDRPAAPAPLSKYALNVLTCLPQYDATLPTICTPRHAGSLYMLWHSRCFFLSSIAGAERCKTSGLMSRVAWPAGGGEPDGCCPDRRHLRCPAHAVCRGPLHLRQRQNCGHGAGGGHPLAQGDSRLLFMPEGLSLEMLVSKPIQRHCWRWASQCCIFSRSGIRMCTLLAIPAWAPRIQP